MICLFLIYYYYYWWCDYNNSGKIYLDFLINYWGCLCAFICVLLLLFLMIVIIVIAYFFIYYYDCLLSWIYVIKLLNIDIIKKLKRI